jgi:hypothetical protein
MSPITSSQVVEQSLAELAWSLWTEPGVSGVFRRHAHWYIDLECLIVLTTALADIDPRLRDESTDWCIRYARFVAAVRLRTLLKRVDAETEAAFGEYAATVRAHTRINWPGSGSPRPYQPTGRSRLHSLDSPALFGVRQRALFGTGARAEIIRLFAALPAHAYTAAELAEEAAFTKRAVEQELDSLRLAGIVTWTVRHGRRRFQIARRDEVLAFVGKRPRWIPRWVPLVRVLLGGLRLVRRAESLPIIVRAVEADKYLREMRSDIELAGLVAPEAVTRGTAAWDVVERWLRGTMSALAAGDPGIFDRSSLRPSGDSPVPRRVSSPT